MQEKTVKESSITSSHLMLMEHAGNFLFNKNNPIGLVHGGIIMKLMDEVAGMVASKHCRRPIVTVLIDNMYFFAPIYIGNKVILKSSINYVGKTSLEVGVRIEAEDLKTGKITHTNTCYLVVVAIDDVGRPTPVPRIKPESDEEKRRYKEAELRNKIRINERKK